MAFGKTSGGYQWLLVCLGNPGKQYEGTRHNIGFMAADELARREGIKINRLRYRALTGDLRLGDQRVLVLKNRGEDPCVIGVKEGESAPDEVTVEAGTVDLKGQVLIDGVPLETYIAMIVAGLMGG